MQARPETTPRFGAGLLGHRTFRQLVKFGLVGATGFVINVGVFAFCLAVLGVHYRLAYVFAFCVAVTNNFSGTASGRSATSGTAATWRCRARASSPSACWRRVAGFVLLEAFVRAGMPKIPGEMLAVALVVPISFLGNKHWSFR